MSKPRNLKNLNKKNIACCLHCGWTDIKENFEEKLGPVEITRCGMCGSEAIIVLTDENYKLIKGGRCEQCSKSYT